MKIMLTVALLQIKGLPTTKDNVISKFRANSIEDLKKEFDEFRTKYGRKGIDQILSRSITDKTH